MQEPANSASSNVPAVERGRFEPRIFCPGFLRGLSFAGKYAFVGLSKPRYKRFEGLALDQRLSDADAEPWCGVQIIDLEAGRLRRLATHRRHRQRTLRRRRNPRRRLPNGGEPRHGATQRPSLPACRMRRTQTEPNRPGPQVRSRVECASHERQKGYRPAQPPAPRDGACRRLPVQLRPPRLCRRLHGQRWHVHLLGTRLGNGYDAEPDGHNADGDDDAGIWPHRTSRCDRHYRDQRRQLRRRKRLPDHRHSARDFGQQRCRSHIGHDDRNRDGP